jgi:hypothetical protein
VKRVSILVLRDLADLTESARLAGVQRKTPEGP